MSGANAIIHTFDTFNLHTTQAKTHAHGPGVRFALWLQGCDLGCPGCCNPQMKSFGLKNLIQVGSLAERILETTQGADPTTGMTLMGGEPTYQSPQIVGLIQAVRVQVPDYSVIVFSGFTLEELRSSTRLGVSELLDTIDVMIDGKYDETERDLTTILGSRNQRLHHLTDRLRGADFSRKPAEFLIASGGSEIIQSGF